MRIIINKIINKVFVIPYLIIKLARVGRNFRFGYASNLERPESFFIGDNFFVVHIHIFRLILKPR